MRESNWWYGVAVVPILTAVVWISHLGAEAGFPLLSVITGIGLVFVGGLLVPLFSVSLIMDVRALNQSENGWNPSKPLYYFIAAIHVFGFVTPLVSLLRYSERPHTSRSATKTSARPENLYGGETRCLTRIYCGATLLDFFVLHSFSVLAVQSDRSTL